MAITDLAVKNAKPKEKIYRQACGDNLYLEVNTKGRRAWRYRWKEKGVNVFFGLGDYPVVSVKKASEKAQKINIRRSEEGLTIDLFRQERTLTSDPGDSAPVTFADVYAEWLEKHKPPIWSEKHYAKTVIRAEKHILPTIGSLPLKEISPPVVLEKVLRPLEAKGVHDTAHRVKGICSMVFQYAVSSGLATFNPTYGLEKAITPTRTTHYPAITTPLEVGRLMIAIDHYYGSAVVHCALRLMPLVFLRTTELRMGQWSEVFFEDAEWRVPSERMKMDNLHIIPLSSQALTILRELHSITGHGPDMFPGAHRGCRFMSDNSISMALRRMGFGEIMTGHGFRSTASTLLNEMGWNSDYIEKQLAHAPRNQVRAAYNRASYLPERRKMMQAWADYLDDLREKAIRQRVQPQA